MNNNLKARLQAYFQDFVDDTGAIQSISLYDLQEMKKELTSENKTGEYNADIKELEILIAMFKASNIAENEYIQFL